MDPINRSLSFLLIIILGAVVTAAFCYQTGAAAPLEVAVTHNAVPSPLPTTTPVPSPSPSSTPVPTPTPAPTLYYPMTTYFSRISVRGYGTVVVPSDADALPCATEYDGIHTGDDLEATEAERQQPVPIYAIAAGTVEQAGAVKGYGGLITIRHQIAGHNLLAYYGHIDLASVSLSKNDTVTAGQQIAVLGEHCGPDSGNERKHLHFSLRLDLPNDVRGYVHNQTDLAEWSNPGEFLKDNAAAEPGV